MDDNYPGTPTPEVQPCSQVPDINQPVEVVRAFLEEVYESDLQEASHFWIQGVWDEGIDQLVTGWADGKYDLKTGTTTYEGFFAPGDYRPMEAGDPRVSNALVLSTIDGQQGSFTLEKTCDGWLISGWIVSDKIKE